MLLPHALCVSASPSLCVFADDAWLTEMAAALNRLLRRVAPGDCLAVVDAFSRWSTAYQQQQQQSSTPPAGQQGNSVAAAVHKLAAGLLVQLSTSAQQYSALQISLAVSSIALQIGYKPSTAQAADAAALQGLKTLLQELSHAQVLADVPIRQVLALLQGLDRMQVQLEQGFVAAVQRDALQPRLKELKPQQFAEAAQALAGLRVQMDKEVLDGYWQEVSDDLGRLSGNLYMQLAWKLCQVISSIILESTA